MIRSAALFSVFASLLGIGAAYLSAFGKSGPPGWAAWAMGVCVPALLVALMALGAARRGRLGWLWVPMAATFVLLAGGFCAVLLMPPANPSDPLWLGLPRPAAVVLYGVGVLPLLLVPMAYALSFDALTLSEHDLARIAAARDAEAEREDA